MWRSGGQIKSSHGYGKERELQHARVINVQCFPLYSILLALNRTVVDYLSLDVEGAELAVLKTIPFDKVNIRVLSVEVTHVSRNIDVQTYMEHQGYKMVTKVTHPLKIANDLVFVSNHACISISLPNRRTFKKLDCPDSMTNRFTLYT